MGELILITGGARSGKSTFAERLAQHYEQHHNGKVIYVATAQVYDEEMAVRVTKHRQQRPQNWLTIEAPYDIESVLAQYNKREDVILVDCITLWLSNLLLSALDEHTPNTDANTVADLQNFADAQLEATLLSRIEHLAKHASASAATVILVTNEVGLGVVPDNPLGRIYRDLSGRANQILGAVADKIYLVVAGYPLDVKKIAQSTLEELKL